MTESCTKYEIENVRKTRIERRIERERERDRERYRCLQEKSNDNSKKYTRAIMKRTDIYKYNIQYALCHEGALTFM